MVFKSIPCERTFATSGSLADFVLPPFTTAANTGKLPTSISSLCAFYLRSLTILNCIILRSRGDQHNHILRVIYAYLSFKELKKRNSVQFNSNQCMLHKTHTGTWKNLASMHIGSKQKDAIAQKMCHDNRIWYCFLFVSRQKPANISAHGMSEWSNEYNAHSHKHKNNYRKQIKQMIHSTNKS